MTITEMTLSWYTPCPDDSDAESLAETLKLPLRWNPKADEEKFRGLSWWIYSFILPTESSALHLRLLADIHKHSHEDRLHWVLTADEPPKSEPPEGIPIAGPETGGLDGFLLKLREGIKLEHLLDVRSEVTLELNGDVWSPSLGGVAMQQEPLVVGNQQIRHFGHHWRSDKNDGPFKTISAFILPDETMVVSVKANINLRVADNLLLEASNVTWSGIGSLLCSRKK
ncbi:hypothetical protein [Paraliomyxa miuraensis]|uniref:hypothetical protein n=1 Tax=Paraliomyxa miuraensis TaxID=376150 RepID=UPI002256BD59|nr:hypothetical protein [Paraliomyxa miuraensis]MCX4244001.1 hypothetical protein [Paraliomyxa miuraensis]